MRLLRLTSILTLLPGLLVVLLTACKSPECYSAADCAGGSTCCDGVCSGTAPMPIGPADCQEGCECEAFQDDDLVRSMCFTYELTQTTQCTRSCSSDADCLAGGTLQGRCLEKDEALLLERLCVWEAP